MTNSKKGYGGAGNCVIVHSYFNKVVKEIISITCSTQDDLQKLKTVLREKRAQLIFIINPNKSTDR